MEPAPGYDPYLPHDLVHLLVERYFGLNDGIYGQLAAGGNAGTFQPVDQQRTRRWARHNDRKNATSGSDNARSEKLAAVALGAWQIRHGYAQPPDNAEHLLAEAGLTDADLPALVDHLDELADQWHALTVGESLTTTWPWPEAHTGRRNKTKEARVR